MPGSELLRSNFMQFPTKFVMYAVQTVGDGAIWAIGYQAVTHLWDFLAKKFKKRD